MVREREKIGSIEKVSSVYEININNTFTSLKMNQEAFIPLDI